MSEEEKLEIISIILSSLRTNAKTINQLPLKDDIDTNDYIELSTGRRVNIGALRNKFLDNLKSLFIRKDISDSSMFTLNLLAGAIFGENGFASGTTGFGAKIDAQGNAEFESITGRRFLQVPELRYNRTKILSGNDWRAAGGIIERVEPDIDDPMSGTAWLKLEDEEVGEIEPLDICMGIFHSESMGVNAVADRDDSLGNIEYAGFYTCYFYITEIQGSHNECFRYRLREKSERWKMTYHPSATMNFVCYGSYDENKPERQCTEYATRTYRRYLVHQNTWEIGPSNIAMQSGDLSNLNIHGINPQGYSTYLNSVYFTGEIKQFNPSGEPIYTAKDKGDYKPTERYYFYDRVSHNGGLWLCINENQEGIVGIEPSETEPSWLCQVKPGDSLTSFTTWKSELTPYPANSMLNFAGKVLLSKVQTSEPPYPLICDINGDYITQSDGHYILASDILNDSWTEIIDTSTIKDGEDGAGLEVRYSSDKTSWHTEFVEGDKWMQQRVGDGSWSGAIQVVGEDGAAGTDGSYSDFQFAKNTSLTEAPDPTAGWQDAPMAVAENEYLWMRTRVVRPNETPGRWSTARIGGPKGENGEGFTNEGTWHTGKVVPKNGMITMGGNTFVCKEETTEPPMFTLLDINGQRIISKDGGYILTGEMNLSKYDLLVEKPKDGKQGKDGTDGKDGKDGKDGEQGKQGVPGYNGCNVFSTEWRLNVEYHNDEHTEPKEGESRKVDYGYVRNNNSVTGWDVYRCIKTHTSSESLTYTNREYWKPVSVNASDAHFDFLLAKNAKIDFLSGNEIRIQNESQIVDAGVSGSDKGECIRFWAGAEQPEQGTFQVEKQGICTASRFRTAKAGPRMEIHDGVIDVFGTVARNIQFGVNDEGLAVLKYFNNEGRMLYDLGPAGIKMIHNTDDSWEEYDYIYIGATEQEVYNRNTIRTRIAGKSKSLTFVAHKFISGLTNDDVDKPDLDQRIYKSRHASHDNFINDGYYMTYYPHTPEAMARPGVETLPNWNPLNPMVDYNYTIYYEVVRHYVGGLATESLFVYFNDPNSSL